MFKKLNAYYQSLAKRYNLETRKFGVFRSLIALSTLLTLVFNKTSTIFLGDKSGKYYNPAFNNEDFWNFFLLFGVEHLFWTKLLAILILLLVISGFQIKITSLLHWWVALSYFKLSSLIDGGDQINSIITLLIIPIAFVDKRYNHWLKSTSTNIHWTSLIAVFSLFVIRVQISAIYFNAAVSKFKVQEWSDGTALYYWFNNSFFGVSNSTEPIWIYLLSFDWFVISLTYGSIVLELLLFSALFAKQSFRNRLFFPALLFHLGIMWLMGIFTFSLTMIACCYFYLLNHQICYEEKI